MIMKQENQTQKIEAKKTKNTAEFRTRGIEFEIDECPTKQAAVLHYAQALNGHGPIDHQPRLASAANAVANLIDCCFRVEVSCHVPEENLRDEIDSMRAAFFDVVSNFSLLIDSLEQRSQDFQYLMKGEQ